MSRGRPVGGETSDEIGVLGLDAFDDGQQQPCIEDRGPSVAIEIVHHAIPIPIHDHVRRVAAVDRWL